ncbi:methanogenesis marker 15 protein [Methanococcus voltae]|uniref:Methanogenesis marker protein 15 n=2 Tax=Methanococcus voltae TaxID=2188 RepID=A0ABT2EVC9_METVO|nr:methanogenesis marker 15 protein [Methanococcus voltae]MBP2171850.1 putative methanogenesis marker protein 15 [Methanococcus voltae]MBP2201195.1 putative methanogenesis marker protein 15 [Methanococcus voltae]MCS3921918.1 putative methanogenesis marker protein 15 [Methanococcus voltae PS]
MTVKIAELTCGAEYSGVQAEIEKAAKLVGGEIVFPEVDLEYIDEVQKHLGFEVASANLKLMFARAMSIIEGKTDAEAVFIATCFRCAEGALVRNEVRRLIQQHTDLPVVMYSFTERTKAPELLTRMEALVTIVEKKSLLARKKQEGISLGLDSGSTTTKAIIMKDNEIVGTGWVYTKDVVKSAQDALDNALKEANLKMEDIETIGTTGYGRHNLGRHFNADLIQEELTVNSKGAAFLAKKQEGEATVIDIGGMDNKAISLNNAIPDGFTMGGICAGASGRFFEMTSRRLSVEIGELGDMAAEGNWRNVMMNSYCIVFGIQDLVTSLAEGATPNDVAAAAAHSVAEQIYEQQLQEVDVREPLILVGGSSLLKGMVMALEEILGKKIVVPEYSQYIGAVGAALLASGYRYNKKK